MTKEHGLLFRSYVPRLVVCLEDADSGVRETAKSTVVELFQYANSFLIYVIPLTCRFKECPCEGVVRFEETASITPCEKVDCSLHYVWSRAKWSGPGHFYFSV